MERGLLTTGYVATLLAIPGIGKRTVQRFLQAVTISPSSLRELYEIFREAERSNAAVVKVTFEQLEDSYRQVEESIERAKHLGVHVIGIDDPAFPKELKQISDPPMILYAKGNLSCLNPQRSIAVIGTRSPTNYGRTSGTRIAQRFAERGLIVVSGLAEGCDTAAHEGCLKGNGQTVAVLAHGLHTVYPKKNYELADRIVASGGCLLSEYPLGVSPQKSSFVERDRLQSGLSSAVLIIETDVQGGTMHTARYCLEQGRALACFKFPPERLSDKSRGNQKLIFEGKARGVWNREEVESFIDQVFPSILESKIQGGSLREEAAVRYDSTQTFTFSLQLNQIEVGKFSDFCALRGMTIEQVLIDFIRSRSGHNTAEHEQLSQYLERKQAVEDADPLSENQLRLFEGTNQIEESNYQCSIQPERQLSGEFKISQMASGKPVELTQKALAERLGVSARQVSQRKLTPEFQQWSKEKDPDGIAWEFSPEMKKFEQCF